MEKIKVYLQVERENCIPKSGSAGSAGADIVAAVAIVAGEVVAVKNYKKRVNKK